MEPSPKYLLVGPNNSYSDWAKPLADQLNLKSRTSANLDIQCPMGYVGSSKIPVSTARKGLAVKGDAGFIDIASIYDPLKSSNDPHYMRVCEVKPNTEFTCCMNSPKPQIAILQQKDGGAVDVGVNAGCGDCDSIMKTWCKSNPEAPGCECYGVRIDDKYLWNYTPCRRSKFVPSFVDRKLADSVPCSAVYDHKNISQNDMVNSTCYNDILILIFVITLAIVMFAAFRRRSAARVQPRSDV
jgi:hypothetical protein